MKKTVKPASRNVSFMAQSAHTAPAGRQGRWSAFVGLMLIWTMALGLAGAAVSAEMQRVKGQGTLTAVRGDGMLIIEEIGSKEDGSQAVYEHGYRLSPRVVVLDSQGKKSSLEKLALPTIVRFEYLYTPKGPEIRLIREVAQ